MNSMKTPRPGALRTMLAGGVLATAAASAIAALPDIRRIDGIETLGGGRSEHDARQLAEVAPRWSVNLAFESNCRSMEALPVAVEVLVRGQSSGAVVLRMQAQGSLLLLRLPPGIYEIEAAAGGLSLAQTVSVPETGSVHARFLWPSNMDFRAAERFRLDQAHAATD